ncbi:hypothetical protein MCETHM1_00559 [Flavobacteriaceae bacterium]
MKPICQKMQIIKSKINFLVLLTLLTTIAFKTHSQTNSDIPLYSEYDSIVGRENLGINNGTLHTDPYRKISQNHRYYIKEEFSIGQLSYDGQIYLNINLKYDLLNDQLIFKHKNQTDNLSINLNCSKTNFFIIKNKKFINFNLDPSLKPDFLKGFYEENFLGNEISLYIKHFKERKEINQFDGIYSDYLEHEIFVIKYQQKFYKINTEKNLKKILPEYKKTISDYYRMNGNLENSNKVQFIENLVRYINNHYPTKA